MSGDSLRKQSKQGNHGQIILPQPVNDLSLIESVAGFIHEVVPQAYSSVLPGDSKDGILWARFDSTDYNDPENFPQISECESESTTPLLLVLGYSSGVQVWSIGGSGEATELLSWCQGAVKALRFLLKPQGRDPHSSKRPLVAIVDSSSPGPQFATLSFISLKTAEVVKIIKFNSPICDVHCNRKSIVVTLNERIAVFDSATLEDRLTITTCYPSPGNTPNPIALGTRWLAYGEKRLTTWQRSNGGCEGEGAQSYTSTVIHAAKSLGKGLRELGGSLTGTQSSHNTQAQPGIVSIVDIEKKGSTNEDEKGNMVAHFVAHTSAVVAMSFDPSGLLLVTADRHGHKFNVFRIHPHPCTSQLAAVHHLYVLHRGETTARVQDITVSWDSRWVAISSVRGTTHVFPITPYGGLVTVRTHTTPHVVNKLSRFERSAGLRDGRGSPLPCEAPATPPPPRLPPYPHPSVVTPLAQLRARPEDTPLAACFGQPRAWLPGKPKSKRTCADSLYVIYSSGAFVQYDLDPKIVQGVPKEKISFDTPIELGVEAKAEWILPKPPYTSSLCPPLPSGHVLLDLPPRPHQPPDKWLSQVEIVSHTGPHRRLWMGPQFLFKSIDPLPVGGGEGDIGTEGGNPLRSNPINMPHRPYLLVEIGSGSPQLAEIDEAGGRLREDLADAMLETHHSSGQSKGKLKRAEVEWQVNPLGAVQTHPAALSHWPHPIFFEPYSPDSSKEVEQSQRSVEAAIANLKLQAQLSDPSLEVPLTVLQNDTPAEIPLSEISQLHKTSCTPKIKPTVDPDAEEMSLEALLRETVPDQEEPLEMSGSVQFPPKSLAEQHDYKCLGDDFEASIPAVVEVPSLPKKPLGRKGRKKKGRKEPQPSSETNEESSSTISDNNAGSEHVDVALQLSNLPTLDIQNKEIETEEHQTFVRSDWPSTAEVKLEGNSADVASLIGCDIFPTVPDSQSVVARGIIPVTESMLSSIEKNVGNNEENISHLEGNNLHMSLEETDKDSHLLDEAESCLEPCPTSLDLPIENPSLSVGFSLLDQELELPPLNFSLSPLEKPALEMLDVEFELKDLNGNETGAQEKCDDLADLRNIGEVEMTLESESDSPGTDTQKENEISLARASVEPDSEEFVAVTSKGSRSRNRRKKKDKKEKPEEGGPDTSESVLVLPDEPLEPPEERKELPISECSVLPTTESKEEENLELSPVVQEVEDMSVNTETNAEDKKQEISSIAEVQSSMSDSSKSVNVDIVISGPEVLTDEIHSDQIAFTDKSEVEDVSSHSGKESDDSKINKKERSRRQKRSESSDKDRSEIKKKSPSPAASKSEAKDSESSDDASQATDIKPCIPKVPKRKKGKKCDEPLTEIPHKEKEISSDSSNVEAVTKGTIKEKFSDSSLESSNSDIRPPPRQYKTRCVAHIIQSAEYQNAVEDRDSVYESCNDDGASDSLAFESSKEDFEEGSSKTTVTEPSSSNAEEKVESGDKVIQPMKKVRKQKKKKR